jgi:hypothetical protein
MKILDPHVPADTDDRSTGELVAELSHQLRRLARAEAKLALTELRRKGRRAAFGGALLGGAATLGLLGTGVLLACAVLALALVLPVWLAALLVGVATLLVAGLCGVTGRAAMRRALPPVDWVANSVKQDLETITHGARR